MSFRTPSLAGGLKCDEHGMYRNASDTESMAASRALSVPSFCFSTSKNEDCVRTATTKNRRRKRESLGTEIQMRTAPPTFCVLRLQQAAARHALRQGGIKRAHQTKSGRSTIATQQISTIAIAITITITITIHRKSATCNACDTDILLASLDSTAADPSAAEHPALTDEDTAAVCLDSR